MIARLLSVCAALACVSCTTTHTSETGRIVLGSHRLIQTDEQDAFAEPADEEGFVVFRMLSAPFQGNDNFQGTARARSKTSLPDAEIEMFNSIADLRATLESDEDMRDGDPTISSTRDSERTEHEQRMVRVHTMLIAVSREDDNDYHLIVADPECRRASCRMNVEVSGLPGRRAAAYAALRDARAQFEAAIGTDIGSGYAFFEPNVAVTIEGALFYDIDHAPGLVGPRQARPDTSWEIHPVSSIEFEG